MAPQRRKQRLIALLSERIAGLARRQPLLLLIEDIHWIDPSSLEALDALVGRVQELPVLAVMTFRPEITQAWSGYGHVTQYSLNRLGRADGQAIAERITGGKQLPEEVMNRILEQTDGVPLFVEELTKTVLEAGILREEADRYVLDGPLPALAIPTTLQDSLMARLDRLAPVKRVIQAAACISAGSSAPIFWRRRCRWTRTNSATRSTSFWRRSSSSGAAARTAHASSSSMRWSRMPPMPAF